MTKTSMSLEGRVGVVTGAGNGLGKACAKALAQHGAADVARHGVLSNAVLPVAITRLAEAMGPDFASLPALDLSPILPKMTPEYITPSTWPVNAAGRPREAGGRTGSRHTIPAPGMESSTA
jgi:hypothetical protein